MLKVLDLFSGIGGFSYGLEMTGGFRTIAFCEVDKFCRKVLQKHWPNVPIFEDVRKLHGRDIPETVNVICGGFPCQGFSVAGKRRGEKDDRYLWPEMFRLVRECRPRWVIGENVAGIISLGLDTVLSDLEGEGYTCRTFVIPACALNAPHRKDRVWIVANSNSTRLQTKRTEQQTAGIEQHGKLGEVLAYPGNSAGRNGEPGSAGRNGRREHEAKIRPSTATEIAGSGEASETLADTNCPGCEECDFSRFAEEQGFRGWRSDAKTTADTKGKQNRRVFKQKLQSDIASKIDTRWTNKEWTTESPVCRADVRLPCGMDRTKRLKALGNSVVSQIPMMIGYAILETEKILKTS